VAPSLVGSGAAVVAAIVASNLAPQHAVTISGLVVRAGASTLLVFVVTVAATFAGAWLVHGTTSNAAEVSFRTALPAAWLTPLLLVFAQKSWFALAVWVLLAAESARLVAFLGRSNRENIPQEEPHSFFSGFPRFDFVPVLGSVAGACCVQAALFAAIASHAVLAAILYLAGTAALVWRGARMLRDSPLQRDGLARRTTVLLAVATSITAFVWLPYVIGPGGRGDSSAVLAALLHLKPARPSPGTPRSPEHASEGGGSPRLLTEVFPGVILYPKTESQVTLIAPSPMRATAYATHATSDSIPFNGVYWFWRPPSDRPPASAVLRYGSPAALTFRSTDDAPLWMEAHQNLGTMINLDCCAAIEMVVESADADPANVSVELILSNTVQAGKPAVSLGSREISGPAVLTSAQAVPQTLTFRIPPDTKLRQFDELAVRFRMKWWRGNRSANVAIDRFRMVPLR